MFVRQPPSSLWIADGCFIGLYRANNVLKHYRGFTMPSGKKFDAWVERLFNHPAFKSTCSTEELYLDSYERWVIGFASVVLCSSVSVDMPSTDLILVKSRTRSILGEGFHEIFQSSNSKVYMY
jgi:hypothetical protein